MQHRVFFFKNLKYFCDIARSNFKMFQRNNLVKRGFLCLLWLYSCSSSIAASDKNTEMEMKTGAKMMESVFWDQNATMQMFDKSGYDNYW